MTADVATRWANTVVPSWLYRWLMPAGWLAAVAVSIATAGDEPCSMDDPTICGPDAAFALTIVPLLATFVLWWWQPDAAAVAGLLFVGLQTWYDGGEVIAEWAIYAAACALLLIGMARARHQQRALTAHLPRRQVMVPSAKPLGVSGRLIAAAVLVIVGAAALGVMSWQDRQEDVHVRRAVAQTAIAGEVNEDEELELKLPDGSVRTASVYDDYAPGAPIPVLVDPADSDWLRLRVQPADHTYWYVVAGGAWLLALLFVRRDLATRRARPRQTRTAPGLPVRIDLDAAGLFAVRSVDGVLIGFLSLELDDEQEDERLFAAIDQMDNEEADAPAAVRAEWAKTLRRYHGEALLVGDLTEGSWPTIVMGDTTLRPVSPLRSPRRTPWSAESVDSITTYLDLEAGDRTEPPLRTFPAREVPTLPWAAPVQPVPTWYRPALAGLLLAAPFVMWLVAGPFGEWTLAVVLGCSGVSLVSHLAGRVFYRVVATPEALLVRAGGSEQVHSWRAIDAVEVGPDRVSLQTGATWIAIDGLASGQAPYVGAVFEALRRDAPGGPLRSADRRWTPMFLVETLYMVTCLAVVGLTRWGPF